MKKTIQIDPVDSEIELLGSALQILNDFRKLGFTDRKSFVEYVMDENRVYCNFGGLTKLNNFWGFRIKDPKLNADLIIILNKKQK